MRNFVLLLLGCMLFIKVHSQDARIDTVAIMIIDRMASVIGDLSSCSFTLETSYDEWDHELGLIKHTGKDDVYLSGPDKMLVHAYGDKGHRGFYYNGEEIVYYSFDENNYAVIQAPDRILDMIDQINKDYGIEFPAADFFFPTFTDDVLEQFETIALLGKKIVNGLECFHILASNQEMTFQFWFANDAFNLPVKFAIVYKNDENKQYQATFSHWELNPELPQAIFEFMPPPGARRISIKSKTGY